MWTMFDQCGTKCEIWKSLHEPGMQVWSVSPFYYCLDSLIVNEQKLCCFCKNSRDLRRLNVKLSSLCANVHVGEQREISLSHQGGKLKKRQPTELFWFRCLSKQTEDLHKFIQRPLITQNITQPFLGLEMYTLIFVHWLDGLFNTALVSKSVEPLIHGQGRKSVEGQ